MRMEVVIKESGEMEKQMAKELIYIPMDKYKLVNGRKINKKVLELKLQQMDLNIKNKVLEQ